VRDSYLVTAMQVELMLGPLSVVIGPPLLETAESRLSRFWSDVMPAIQAHWALIAAAAEVLLQADRVAKALKKAPSTLPALIRAYAEGEAPWCLLDTAHRHMESRWYAFEPESGTDYGSLEQLVVKAEQRHAEVGSELAQYFTRTFEKAKHPRRISSTSAMCSRHR